MHVGRGFFLTKVNEPGRCKVRQSINKFNKFLAVGEACVAIF